MRDVDLTKIHYLTGPFEIETAEPGDILVVEIQDVQPLEDQPWGFTGVFSKKNGGVSRFPGTERSRMSFEAGQCRLLTSSIRRVSWTRFTLSRESLPC
jgi:acetamidase/formamidase